MFKKILLCVGLLSLVISCGGKPVATDEDPTAAIRRAIAEYDRDVCGQKAFVGTKKFLMDSDKYAAMGDLPRRDLINKEVVKTFAKEEPPYKELLHQRKRTNDLNAELANEDRNPINSGSMKWSEKKAKIRQYLDNAKKASDNCDDKTARINNDKAEELLTGKAPVKREEPVATPAPKPVAKNGYTVVKGDCLWNISKSNLKNPYLWPIIYWGNKSEINDPDLIFPGQVFTINKNAPLAEKKKATRFARTRGKWSLYDGK